MLNDMYSAMIDGDTLTHRASSGTYVKHIHDTIGLVLDEAVKEGILVANLCDNATPPKKDTGERHAIEPEKVHEFVSELDPRDDRDCAYLLAISTGMRCGEICGLSWKDVDFDWNIISVNHSLDVFNELKSTKTKAGVRLLPMPDGLADALKVHKKAQAARYELLNKHGASTARARTRTCTRLTTHL